jgi:hypothetical protein
VIENVCVKRCVRTGVGDTGFVSQGLEMAGATIRTPLIVPVADS